MEADVCSARERGRGPKGKSSASTFDPLGSPFTFSSHEKREVLTEKSGRKGFRISTEGVSGTEEGIVVLCEEVAEEGDSKGGR